MRMAASWGFEEGGSEARVETKDGIELQQCYVLNPSVLDRGGTRPGGSRDGWIWWTVWFTQSRKHPAGAGARFDSAHRRRAARLSIVERGNLSSAGLAAIRVVVVSGARMRGTRGWCFWQEAKIRPRKTTTSCWTGNATQRQRGERGTACRMARSLVLVSLRDARGGPSLGSCSLRHPRQCSSFLTLHLFSSTRPLGPSPHPLRPPCRALALFGPLAEKQFDGPS